jgi:hypothetical protein
MREKKFIRTLSCVCVVLMACGTAFAQQHGKLMAGPYKGPMGPVEAPEAPAAAPFFSNLVANPCVPGQMYDTNSGFFILGGPANCFDGVSTQWVAYPFIAGHSGNVKKVQLALTNDSAICTPTSSKATVAIYSDACLLAPQTQIGNTVIFNIPAAPPALASANFGMTGPALVQGTQYWVVVTTSSAASQNADTAVWWEAVSGVFSVNFNDGMGWQAGAAASPGGFSVQ